MLQQTNMQGCIFADKKREAEGRLQHKCPFCRTVSPQNSGRTIDEKGKSERSRCNELNGIKKIQGRRLQRSVRVLDEGSRIRRCRGAFWIINLVSYGEGAEKDEKKQLHHTEQAAIAGHPYAIHNLALSEDEDGRLDKAVKHWIIDAKLGAAKSLDNLR